MAKKSRKSQIVKMKSLPRQDYRLKITLDGIDPPIWRRFQVPAEITLARLHDVIQAVMGWENGHLYAFTVGNKEYQSRTDPMGFPLPDPIWPGATRGEDAAKAKLRDVASRIGAVLQYEYDFGDSWEHTIRVEDIAAGSGSERYRCLEGERACPPEDCGGIWGYQELLEELQKPDNEKHSPDWEWLAEAYEGFDPEAFDLNRVNTWLKSLR